MASRIALLLITVILGISTYAWADTGLRTEFLDILRAGQNLTISVDEEKISAAHMS